MNDPAPVSVQVATVDVYLIRPRPDGWKVLVLRRTAHTRCPGSWEAVHGRMESGERPDQAAIREVREETGLEVTRLFNVTVQPFYMQSAGVVTAAVVFSAFVDEPGDVRLSEEHDAHEWLDAADAERRFVWPRSRTALREILELLQHPELGTIEDVVRMV